MSLISRINDFASTITEYLSTLDSKGSIICITILVYLLFILFVLVIKNTQNLLDEFFAIEKIKSFFLSKPKLYSFIRFLIIVPYILLLGGRYFIILPAFYFIFFDIDQKPYFIWNINMIIILMSFSLFFIGFNLFLKKKKYGYFGKFSLLMASFSFLIYTYFIMFKLGIYEFHFKDVRNWSLVIISIVCEYNILFFNQFNLPTVANIGEIFKTILKIILNRVSPAYRYYSMFKSIYQYQFKVLKMDMMEDLTYSNGNNNSNENNNNNSNENNNSNNPLPRGFRNAFQAWYQDNDTINPFYNPIRKTYCWDPSIPFSLPASSDVNPAFRAGIRNSDTFWGTKTVNGVELPLVFYNSVGKIPYHYALLDPNYEEMIQKYKNSIIQEASKKSSYAGHLYLTNMRERLFDHYIKIQQQHTQMLKSVVFHKLLALDGNNIDNARGVLYYDEFETLRLRPSSLVHRRIYYHFYEYRLFNPDKDTGNVVYDPKFVKQYCYFIRKSDTFNSELFLAHCHKIDRLETYFLTNRPTQLETYIKLDYVPIMNKGTYLHIDGSLHENLRIYNLHDYSSNRMINSVTKEAYMACVMNSINIIEECLIQGVWFRGDINYNQSVFLAEEYRYLLNAWRMLEIDKINVLFDAPYISNRDTLLNLNWGLLKNESWIQESRMLAMLVKKNPYLIAHIKYPESAIINEIARLHSRFGK